MQILSFKMFFIGVTPEFLSNSFMKFFRKGLNKAKERQRIIGAENDQYSLGKKVYHAGINIHSVLEAPITLKITTVK